MLLNDRIIQQLYRIKTIDRNSEWDTIWYLGGKNQVSLGEKERKYYLLPSENIEPVIEILPQGMVQGHKIIGSKHPQMIITLGDLERVYPELTELFTKRHSQQ